MARPFDDARISLILSEALNEIGVNERMVKVRRKCILLQESTFNMCKELVDNDDNMQLYMFGSQSEGSTTLDLNSDMDCLICIKYFHVIQDWANWRQGVENLLIVQDESTSPGYCLLQVLRDDEPLGTTYAVSDEELTTDDKGRVLVKNTLFSKLNDLLDSQQSGPACTFDEIPGKPAVDSVPALYCNSWPVKAMNWLQRPNVGNWPSVPLKRLAASKGCFLVPVASKCNNLTNVEWRISTSMAERLLMFDLNITQIHCYVVLKYISKTYLQMNDQTLITSFMCKCTLFHCIENTPSSHWRENNLFPCVMHCLIVLHERVRELNCPHYIIPANNLMANRINDLQRRHLLNVMERLIRQNFDLLHAIKIDMLGQRIQVKTDNAESLGLELPLQNLIESIIVTTSLYNLGHAKACMLRLVRDTCKNETLSVVATVLFSFVQKLQLNRHIWNELEPEAYHLVVQPLCAMIGSVLASYSVYLNRTVSPEALRWFSTGLNTDVSSVRLKLASAFYCAGDLRNAEVILFYAKQRHNDVVLPLCTCYRSAMEPHGEETMIERLYENNGLLDDLYSMCVQFMPCEASIIPRELRHEFFRSTTEERESRTFIDTCWMDFAVVDPLPYLYFLQYKVYKQLYRYQEQRQALSNLLNIVLKERNLFHRETAWNLLGQCMQQEGMPVDAMWCYNKSLEVRATHNAARTLKRSLLDSQRNLDHRS